MIRTSRTLLTLSVALGAAGLATAAQADSVYLQNGRVIHSSEVRVDGDRVLILLHGSTQAIPLSLVDRIEQNDRRGPGEAAAAASPSTGSTPAGSAASAAPNPSSVGGVVAPAERMRALTDLLQQNGGGSPEVTGALELLQSLGASSASGSGDLTAQLGALGALGGLGGLGGELGGLGKDLEQAQTILPLLAQLGSALFAPEFSPDASADALQNLLSGLRSLGVTQAQIEAEARRLGVPPEILAQLWRR